MRVFAVWKEFDGLAHKLEERCGATVVHSSELADVNFIPDDIVAYDSSCDEDIEAALCYSAMQGVQLLPVLFCYEPQADDDSIFTRLIVNDIAELEIFVDTLRKAMDDDAAVGCDSKDISGLFSKGGYAKMQLVESTEQNICEAMSAATAKLISDVNISAPTDLLIVLTVPSECAFNTVDSAIAKVNDVLDGKAFIKMAISYSADNVNTVSAVMIATGMKAYS